ncbi:centromere protein C isoform X1 [Myotis daubentonii]|uniref:centromere protein C isoform X1 n=1 Tax=Myotis daubentonii TaxID=98922 RepID=UPI002873046B|nr:centromere protein C isoform X1 [Myotis daubentonii]
MAASGLDHLKNGYRRRFCQPSREPGINVRQGQNILVLLQDCFEEQSLANDFSTNSTNSMLCSTPKIKDSCLQSPSREAHCQISHSKSVRVSSRKKGASLQFPIEPSEAVSVSVQAHEVPQKIVATDVGSKTPDSRKMSNKKLKDHHNDANEEFYLSVGSPFVLLDAKTSVPQNAVSSIGQQRETYTFEDSVNVLSSSTEISLKTKKRLDFEDKDILKKVETENKVSDIDDEVSERPQERNPPETPQKIMQGSEHEIQPQAKKSFSSLFLETLKRKSESSPVFRHIATAPPQSSPATHMNLEDEFIIDESDSFASQSWITIPRKAVPGKQSTVSPTESTARLQSKKSREKHHSLTPTTLTNDKHSGKAHPLEKSQPSDQRKLGRNCALTDEMENRSTKTEMYSKNAEKSSGNKRTTTQKQKNKLKVNKDMEQGKDKNINMSSIARDKSQRNSDRSMKACKEKRNVHISKKRVPPVGSKKSSTSVPHTANQGKNRECEKENFSNGSRKNSLVLEEVTLTVTKSQRISRRPSNWWMVKSDQSLFYSSTSVRNELPVHDNSGQKSAKKTNQSSKNIGGKTVPFKGRKKTTGRSKTQKILNAKDSRRIIDPNEISGSFPNEYLECDEADMAKKKDVDHSGVAGSSKDDDSVMTAKNVHLKPQSSGHPCKTPAESDSDFEEPKTLVLEGSGPFRLKNYLMSGKNNSDVDDEEVQENSDNSRVKRSGVAQKNKIHHKLVLPSNTPNLRRTKRIRLKPLEYWRGERVDYQERKSGGFVIGGILSPETVSSKRKAKGDTKKAKQMVNRKRICLDNDERKKELVIDLNIPLGDPLQPTWVRDPETRKIILMELLRPRDTYTFSVEQDELKVYKTLDTPLFSTGKLILGPHQEKGKQHVGRDTLVFYVNFGDLLCTLHETSYVITTGDSFYVPSGNYYNIKNLLNEDSVLLFTQIKR